MFFGIILTHEACMQQRLASWCRQMRHASSATWRAAMTSATICRSVLKPHMILCMTHRKEAFESTDLYFSGTCESFLGQLYLVCTSGVFYTSSRWGSLYLIEPVLELLAERGIFHFVVGFLSVLGAFSAIFFLLWAQPVVPFNCFLPSFLSSLFASPAVGLSLPSFVPFVISFYFTPPFFLLFL